MWYKLLLTGLAGVILGNVITRKRCVKEANEILKESADLRKEVEELLKNVDEELGKLKQQTTDGGETKEELEEMLEASFRILRNNPIQEPVKETTDTTDTEEE